MFLVLRLVSGRRFSVEVDPCDDVADVKKKVQNKAGIPVEKQSLWLHPQRELLRDLLLIGPDLNLRTGQVVDVKIRSPRSDAAPLEDVHVMMPDGRVYVMFVPTDKPLVKAVATQLGVHTGQVVLRRPPRESDGEAADAAVLLRPDQCMNTLSREERRRLSVRLSPLLLRSTSGQVVAVPLKQTDTVATIISAAVTVTGLDVTPTARWMCGGEAVTLSTPVAEVIGKEGFPALLTAVNASSVEAGAGAGSGSGAAGAGSDASPCGTGAVCRSAQAPRADTDALWGRPEADWPRGWQLAEASVLRWWRVFIAQAPSSAGLAAVFSLLRYGLGSRFDSLKCAGKAKAAVVSAATAKKAADPHLWTWECAHELGQLLAEVDAASKVASQSERDVVGPLPYDAELEAHASRRSASPGAGAGAGASASARAGVAAVAAP